MTLSSVMRLLLYLRSGGSARWEKIYAEELVADQEPKEVIRGQNHWALIEVKCVCLRSLLVYSWRLSFPPRTK